MEAESEGVAVLGKQPISRGQRIKKRSLRNKSLSVTFNEKDLRDYVSGFHKRKKKRRKEAYKKQEEAARRKRLEGRKKRKLEKEFALHGGAPPAIDAEKDGEDPEEDDESELNPSISGTTTYDNGDVMVTVTTCEIGPEEEVAHPKVKSAPPLQPSSIGGAGKKHNIPITKSKPFKKAAKGRSRPKLKSKRDRKKGKNNDKKRF